MGRLALIAIAIFFIALLVWVSRVEETQREEPVADAVPQLRESSDSSKPEARSAPSRRNAAGFAGQASTAKPSERAPPLPPFVSPLHRHENARFAAAVIRERIMLEGAELFSEISKSAREGDAEAAFSYYLYLDLCRNSPRTERHLDMIISGYRDHYRGRDGNPKMGISSALSNFERCAMIDPAVDVVQEALRWLTLSADLGYMVAQLLYYERAKFLIGNFGLGFREPDLIYQYRDRSRLYLQNLLESGHPEAYSLMARAVSDGVLFDQDDVLAFAYAHLAREKEFNDPAGAPWSLYTRLEGMLTLSQANEAKGMAQQLCERLPACH